MAEDVFELTVLNLWWNKVFFPPLFALRESRQIRLFVVLRFLPSGCSVHTVLGIWQEQFYLPVVFKQYQHTTFLLCKFEVCVCVFVLLFELCHCIFALMIKVFRMYISERNCH